MLGATGQEAPAAAAAQLRAVYRLSDPALSELPLPRLLDEVLVRVRELLDVDTVAILLLDPSGKELVARAAKGIEEEVEQGVRIPVGRGFAGRIAAERAPIVIADVDHADVLNPLLRAAGIRSLLGVPLVVHGKTIGVLHVGSLTPREFGTAEATVLELAGSRVAPAIEHAELVDALDREHRSAVALQRTLLPEVLPSIPEVDAAGRYLPARDEVGGDWYDVFELRGSQVGIAIGDVAGHGVRAAALMGQLRTGLRAYALEGHPPGEVLRLLDDLLHTLRGRGMATAAYGLLDTESGALTIASAGHPPPLVVGGGEARLLAVPPAPPLGVLSFPQYPETELELDPGHGIVLYTDGLVERRDAPLADELEALRRAAEGAERPAARLCDRLVRALVGDGTADDDVALVAVVRDPVSDALRLRLAAEPEDLRRVRRALTRWLRANGAGGEDLHMIGLAVGEAAANAVEHAYPPGPATFDVEASIDDGCVTVSVRDHGGWREPRGEHRGRGLTIMRDTMDEVDIRRDGTGTEVVLRRRLRA